MQKVLTLLNKINTLSSGDREKISPNYLWTD